MKKKLLSMMLALSMVLALLPGTAFAGSVTFGYADGQWTVSDESGNYTVNGTSITYTVTLDASSIEIKADSYAEADMEALPDGLTDAQKAALETVAILAEDLGLLLDREDISDELIEAGRKALADAGSVGSKNASVNLGLSLEITDAVFDQNDQVTSLTLEIKMVYTVTVDGKESEPSVLTFGDPIALTVTVPEGMLANGANVSVEHSKDGSSYHPHAADGIDRTSNTVTFTSDDGLGSFTISSTQPSGGGNLPSTPSTGGGAPSTGGTGGGATHTHYDRDNDHKCDDDGTMMTDHADEDADHICDICGETVTDHTDGDADRICDICGETMDGDDIIIGDEDVPLDSRPFLFADVAEGDWLYNDVKMAYNMNLMDGASKTVFDPHSPTTRGMVAQVLYNMEGRPSIDGYDVTVPDLKTTDWYYNAAIWAYATGVYAGYADGTFHGDDLVTREQLMLVLYRYSMQKGYDVSAADNLAAFADKNSTSSWALEGVQWAVGAELIRGRGSNQIAPDANTMRAELATILVRFVDAYTDIV